MLEQGRQKGLRYKKGIYANRTDIHGKPNTELVRYSSRKRKEKEDCEKTDRDRTRTGIVQIAGGLSSYTRLGTSHLTQAAVNRHPPPHDHATPSPSPSLLAPRPTLPGPQRSTHTRPPPHPRAVGGPFSVQQPCESHVVRTPAVIPRPPCLSTKCHSTRQPIPRSAAGPMLPL